MVTTEKTKSMNLSKSKSLSTGRMRYVNVFSRIRGYSPGVSLVIRHPVPKETPCAPKGKPPRQVLIQGMP